MYIDAGQVCFVRTLLRENKLYEFEYIVNTMDVKITYKLAMIVIGLSKYLFPPRVFFIRSVL